MNPASTHRRRPARHCRYRSTLGPAVVAAALAILGVGCSDAAQQPTGNGEPGPDSVTDVTHTIDPTDQMRDAAVQQCLDDADLVSGYVRAVDPTNGNVLSEIEVDCREVRSGTDG